MTSDKRDRFDGNGNIAAAGHAIAWGDMVSLVIGMVSFPDIISTGDDSPVLLETLLGLNDDPHADQNAPYICGIDGVELDPFAPTTLPGVRVGEGDGAGYILRRERDSRLIFVPDAGYEGIVKFAYTVADAIGDEVTVLATVNVEPPRLPSAAEHLFEGFDSLDGTDFTGDLIAGLYDDDRPAPEIDEASTSYGADAGEQGPREYASASHQAPAETHTIAAHTIAAQTIAAHTAAPANDTHAAPAAPVLLVVAEPAATATAQSDSVLSSLVQAQADADQFRFDVNVTGQASDDASLAGAEPTIDEVTQAAAGQEPEAAVDFFVVVDENGDGVVVPLGPPDSILGGL